MGYWFHGFFLRTAAQDNLSELVSSIKEQWPQAVCRPIREPFVGLGIRMTNFTWGVDDERAEKQCAIEEELPGWSAQHPSLTAMYLEADCFGGTCLYRGYICREGKILLKEQALDSLLAHIGVKLAGDYFLPFERNFFGPERYFRQGEVEADLEDFLRHNTEL